MFLHDVFNTEDFVEALSSSTFAPLGTTDNICQKSPDIYTMTIPILELQFLISRNVLTTAPKAFLWTIVHPFQTIKRQLYINSPFAGVLDILQNGLFLYTNLKKT